MFIFGSMIFLQEFAGLDSCSLLDVLELVEVCQDSLDDVWKCDCVPAYPEKRMKHLMDLIGMFHVCHNKNESSYALLNF